MVAAPPRGSASNLAGGMLDMVDVSFRTSTGLSTETGFAGGADGVEEGRSGSSSRFLFHMLPPSLVECNCDMTLASPGIRGQALKGNLCLRAPPRVSASRRKEDCSHRPGAWRPPSSGSSA